MSLAYIPGILFATRDSPDDNLIFIPVMGHSRLMFDSNPDYINDHAVIKANDGWHMIGITHKKVLGGRLPIPYLEEEFAHAVAPDLEGPWTRLPYILRYDKSIGETHVWAPHIIYNDGLYYCFYAAGGGHWNSMINLATSPDLKHWTRHPENPLFTDFYDARDPMVTRIGDQWVMYYTKTYSKEERYSTVAYRTSDDLIHWSESGFALVLKGLHTFTPNSPHTESPFLLEYRGLYYLFICTPEHGYRCTCVFVSRDPFHFEEDDEIATIAAHCAEVISDGDKLFVSHAGWYYDGFYLASMKMVPGKKTGLPPAFADCGENNDYLVSAPGAKVVRRLINVKALKVGRGESIIYEFPVPRGVERLGLVIEERGETKVYLGSCEVILDEGEAGMESRKIHTFEITDRDIWKDGKIRVHIEDSGKEFSDRPEIYYIKLYYR